MSYPVSEDLQAFALNAGVIAAGSDLSLDYGRILTSAIKQWEFDTGWSPFIAEQDTRVYDYPYPDGRILDFRGGILSIDSFTVSGTALTAGVEYVLYPLRAPNIGKPYTWLEMIVRFKEYWLFTLPGIINITGTFGYAADCPDDVKEAILSLACSNLLPTKSGAATGMVQRIKQDSVEYQYVNNVILDNATTPQQAQLTQFYKDAVKRYKRVRIF